MLQNTKISPTSSPLPSNRLSSEQRDSFILQGSGFFAQNNGLGLQVKYEDTDIPLPEMSSELFRFLLFPNPTEQQFSTSLSYQATFKRSYLRVGIGWSTIPYQWMTNSLEYAWRFGGATKKNERQNAGYVRAQQRSSKGRS